MPLFRLLADRPDPCSPRIEVVASPAERIAEQLRGSANATAHAAALVARHQGLPVSEVLGAWLGGGPPLRRDLSTWRANTPGPSDEWSDGVIPLRR